MTFHNLKISFKNLVKNRFVTGLNLFGLSIGICVSLLLFAYAQKESSMDQYIPKVENAYVISNYGSGISLPMAEVIRKAVPEIQHLTVVQKEWSPQVIVRNEKNSYSLNELLIADSSFFHVLQFEALYGDLKTALSKRNQIVLTEDLSKKIFGNINPVGKTLVYNATYLSNQIVEVSAVMKKLPNNSSFQFEAVLSFSTNEAIRRVQIAKTYWGMQNYRVLASFPSALSASMVKSKIENMNVDHAPEKYRDDIKLTTIPFADSYYTNPTLDVQKHGSKQISFFLRALACLIILLAVINYVNIVTAQKLKRIQSIGVLKVLGSKSKSIISLLTLESVIIVVGSGLLVLLLTYYLLPILNKITLSNFTFFDIFSGANLLSYFFVLLLTVCLTGILPGVLLSKNKAIFAIKNMTSLKSKNYFRNILIVLQFSVSILLLISIITINRQNQLLLSTNPGFAKENIVYASCNSSINNQMDAFIDAMKLIPAVKDITYTSDPLGYGDSNWGVRYYDSGEPKHAEFAYFSVAQNFIDFFDLKIVQGRSFNQQSFELGEWIFNEQLCKKNQIQRIDKVQVKNFSDKLEKAVGIVKNFNFQSMHIPIESAAFRCKGKDADYVYYKLYPQNYNKIQNTLEQMKEVWNRFSPDFPLEIQYMDQKWEALYSKEKRFQEVVKYASIISILLSCLGLISLTFFIVETQTKEIGVRKVNGAKTFEIVKMLNKDLLKWILFAFLLACPIAYFFLLKWLDNFAYKTDLSWWIFALAGLVTLIISLLTVSIQSIHAAKMNPVKALRYE